MGNVREVINAIKLTTAIMMDGMGSSNSATRGAKTVMLFATKLTIPIVVALLKIGNIF